MVLFLTIIMITLRRRGSLSLVFNGLIYSVVFSLVLMIIDNIDFYFCLERLVCNGMHTIDTHGETMEGTK